MLITGEAKQNQLVVAVVDGLNRRDYSESFIMIDIHSEIRQNRKDILKYKILKSGKEQKYVLDWFKINMKIINTDVYFANLADSKIYGYMLGVILLSKNLNHTIRIEMYLINDFISYFVSDTLIV